ncbi:N-acetylglutamate synthase-like GNAT family acetyltransferase [Breznakia sp. PF5-3]|uniref:GNAT family N-acetyltransferase n=1 Tax=unclassified Breznakia TaxID=2623764 RepID=UPI002404DB69|nr:MULTISPECIES: GNAT family N-acetyltransferase [unclassified Breznakia]MDF9824173.1 N-acetylglutamate synthase-like GNAT family acetyltransferase [Breznakia sp. PM6-1]MDF9834971.1 N-acetylglutamate synthase-like GNAT family acetyltransferase [Breznakia sp. PF5-3]MDF9837160.1 N-acetylglutamate synthase-like GNAT family acetyltransferase [Breznakia sp. PFB2-8]MDF9859150.1 N-acetylglutamate synthase-like GNAT family acetyltransferase [Breznakia sp. PH5-24]
MHIISIREQQTYALEAIRYFQAKWGDIVDEKVYEDSILKSLQATSNLPQWYLLFDSNTIAGCAGLIENDFINRTDLKPWLCALYVEENYRGNRYAKLLIDKIKDDTKQMGYERLYLCSDHIGYYEQYGFTYIGDGEHPDGETSRIYEVEI